MSVRSSFVTEGSDTKKWLFRVLTELRIALLLHLPSKEARRKCHWEQGHGRRDNVAEFQCSAPQGSPLSARTCVQGRFQCFSCKICVSQVALIDLPLLKILFGSVNTRYLSYLPWVPFLSPNGYYDTTSLVLKNMAHGTSSTE